jgi:N-formylglutamate amidohydrolase
MRRPADLDLVPAEIHEPELDPPFDILEPEMLRSPIVLSSPHSGDVYPRRVLEASRLEPLALRRSEDAHVDALLAEGATAIGAPLLRARFPRAYVDVNREPYELDPRMFDGRLPACANTRSVRVAGGLGTIARIVGEAQEIYAHRLPVQEAMDRVSRLYEPYHSALRGLLARAQRVFGIAVLIDCHSMPSTSLHASSPLGRAARAEIIIGDRYGASCAPIFVDAIESSLRGRGYVVGRNKPYAGGYITERYGTPIENCHAVQIEVGRALYMDERTLLRSESFGRVSTDLAFMTEALDSCLPRDFGIRQAAE